MSVIPKSYDSLLRELEQLESVLYDAEKSVKQVETELDALASKHDKLSAEYRAFVDQTAEVRRLQIEYFKTRDKDVLKKSKNSEHKLDRLIIAFREREANTELPF